MFQQIKSGLGRFWRDTDGAVTVDWVVLLAGILGMIFIVMASISGGVQVFGQKAGEELSARDIGTY
jgi:Flp pilus assembly pilin Flp